MNQYQHYAIALAGICQNVALIPQLARHGRFERQMIYQNLKPIFVLNPDSTLDVYGDIKNLEPGLILLRNLLSSHQAHDMELLRYLLGTIKVAAKLLKNPNTQQALAARLQHLSQHFPLQESNWQDTQGELLTALGGVYADLLSPLTTKIQINGQELYLKNPMITVTIRALLLGAVRSAVLWYQVGGKRWQFFFARKKIINAINDLLSQC